MSTQTERTGIEQLEPAAATKSEADALPDRELTAHVEFKAKDTIGIDNFGLSLPVRILLRVPSFCCQQSEVFCKSLPPSFFDAAPQTTFEKHDFLTTC